MRTAFYVALAVTFLTAAFAVYHAASAPTPAGAGYWHTSGTLILDGNDRQVRIAGVTWYGMETSYWVPAGLDYQPYTRIMDELIDVKLTGGADSGCPRLLRARRLLVSA